MSDQSEALLQLLESLGIKNGDPILKEDHETENIPIKRIGRKAGSFDHGREGETKDEEEWFDSINSDDIDALKDYGTTPPRTERNRKQRERNAYCSHAVAAAKSFSSRNKHRLANRCASLPLTTPLITTPTQAQKFAEESPKRLQSFRQRKRSQDLQRTYERQCKLMVEELPNELISSVSVGDDEVDEWPKCESLPPLLAVKVPTRSRYMCVSSRRVGGRDWSKRKLSTAGLPPDRVSFHAHIVGLLKHNSQDHSMQLKSRSEEDVLYQQEINEMIWLELQAWHAGQDTLAYDNFLLEQRLKVKTVYDEVLTFHCNFDKNPTKLDADSETAAKEKKCAHFDLPTGETCLLYDENDSHCTGCLSVWCSRCRERESQALEKVWYLLERVDYVHSLFPSSRKLSQFFPAWNDEEFTLKYKALCLWFNMTSQLRFVIDLLGRRLGHMTKDIVPWPSFADAKHSDAHRSPSQSVNSRDSGSHSMEDPSDHEAARVPSSTTASVAPSKKPASEHVKEPRSPVVKFQVEDLDESVDESSDPNQSTESSDMVTSSSSSQSHSDFFRQRPSDYLSPPEPSHGLRRCSSDIFLEANPYRTYVSKLLRNKGMKKTLDKVAEVIRDVMTRTGCVIQNSHSLLQDDRSLAKAEADTSLGLSPHPLAAFQEELKRHPNTNWMAKFSSSGLPSFHTLFLFLASIPLHMMRECLKIRLEQMPNRPSRMSIKQLMSEYKEGVKFAVAVRQKFVKWCCYLLTDLPPPLAFNLEARKGQAIEELDSNVKKMLEVYLEWLDQFILMLHRETHVAGLQRNFLQEEWCFVQATCPHVTDGESLAATRFCNIACHMLCSVRDFLDTGLDDMISDLQATALDGAEEGEEEEEEEEEDFFDLEEEQEEEHIERYFRKKKLVVRCRSVQDLTSEARERALRAVALAKMLKMDLEVAIEARELPEDPEVLLGALLETKHVLVEGHSLRNLAIFVPESLAKSPDEILSILQMKMGVSSDKYLLLVNLPPDTCQSWKGRCIHLCLSADCAITLSRVQVCGLMLIVKDGSQLPGIRRTMNEALKDVVVFSNEQIAPHKAVTQTLWDMKTEALELCRSLEKSLSNVEELVSVAHYFPRSEDELRQLSHLVRDTLHQGFLFGFEYHKEALRLVSGRQRSELAPMLIHLGRRWMKFVRSHYSTGKGSRPRWAGPGFEFMLLVCDPHNTREISDADFKVLRTEVEECREYIIGSASNSESSAPSTPLLIGRNFKSQSSNSSLSHNSSQLDSPSSSHTDSPKFRSPLIRYSQLSFDRPDEPEEEPETLNRENPMEDVRVTVAALDARIQEHRLQENLVGRVSHHNRDLIEIKPHRVSFSWHRGFKIGAGHFGKVYTAVNNNSGELMAMKVLPLQPNDHRSIKRVAVELQTFERINHPHLVKYYGIEIHNDEMLMFMEYCDEGTLEALAASTEGLPEEIVRKYTRQLLSAVHTMHENGIVHRDIKGANIFLAKEGNILKLGDFGCAVRLRGLQTEVNELSGIVGTHAFMAPEIFGSNEGHGRAADIWSVGCVLIEMVTGKRPWPQYDSSVQIMFQVGSGSSPQIPDSLSEEGGQFLRLCFIHSSKERATAATLLDHTFVKVEEEENVSVPMFSLYPSMQSWRTRFCSGGDK